MVSLMIFVSIIVDLDNGKSHDFFSLKEIFLWFRSRLNHNQESL